MLYLLVIVAIVAGTVVLVMQPAMERADTLDATILEKQMSVDSMRVSLQEQQVLREEIENNMADIEEESEFFFPVLTNNEMDEYITGLLQMHGLTALSLVISTQEENAENVPGEEEDAELVFHDTRCINVNTTARGTMRQFMLLVDTVKELDGIRIVSIKNGQDAVTTPAPTPTPKPSRKALPALLLTTPEPIATEGTYTMEIVFSVLEYAEGKTTSVTLDREE